MGNINICGKPKCCPDVVANKAGTEVILTENGAVIKLTFEQVAQIYKAMCSQKQECYYKCCGES